MIIELDRERFDALVALLDRDPEECPKLRALLTTPTIFDKE